MNVIAELDLQLAEFLALQHDSLMRYIDAKDKTMIVLSWICQH
jgi:hypothetical protein